MVLSLCAQHYIGRWNRPVPSSEAATHLEFVHVLALITGPGRVVDILSLAEGPRGPEANPSAVRCRTEVTPPQSRERRARVQSELLTSRQKPRAASLHVGQPLGWPSS